MGKPKPTGLPPLRYEWTWMLPSDGAEMKIHIVGCWDAEDAVQAATLLDMVKASIIRSAARREAETQPLVDAPAGEVVDG